MVSVRFNRYVFPNAPISDVDFATSIEASLAPRGLKILVHEKFQDQLRNKGFGELEKL